jgi:hypothetical protein
MPVGRLPVLAAFALAVGCASETSDAVQLELTQAAIEARDGVQKIHRALANLDLSSTEFGEGVQQVEQAARMLGALEADDRASEGQRLSAALLQARAWDDAARAIEIAAPEGYTAEQQELTRRVLDEKAFPVRVAAQTSFRRVLRWACRAGAEEIALEAADGVARYTGRSAGPEPCRD